MACPKHVVNCPDRLKKSNEAIKKLSKPAKPTTTTINGVVYLVTPKKQS